MPLSEYDQRQQITHAYGIWIERLWKEGWTPYFTNFMFNHIHQGRAHIMTDEVMRVYSTFISHDVRSPRDQAQQEWLARFIGSLDMPVPKHKKMSLQEATVNDGLHFNGMFLISPKTRLKCSLRKHFKKNKHLYIVQDRPLARIHVTRMTYGNMTDYSLKAFKSGRVDGTDILILPRSRSEIAAQSAQGSR